MAIVDIDKEVIDVPGKEVALSATGFLGAKPTGRFLSNISNNIGKKQKALSRLRRMKRNTAWNSLDKLRSGQVGIKFYENQINSVKDIKSLIGDIRRGVSEKDIRSKYRTTLDLPDDLKKRVVYHINSVAKSGGRARNDAGLMNDLAKHSKRQEKRLSGLYGSLQEISGKLSGARKSAYNAANAKRVFDQVAKYVNPAKRYIPKALLGLGAVSGAIAGKKLYEEFTDKYGKPSFMKSANMSDAISKIASAFIAVNPERPKTDLITPKINTSNKSLREGIKLNNDSTEQLSSKKKPKMSTFKMANVTYVGGDPKNEYDVDGHIKSYKDNISKNYLKALASAGAFAGLKMKGYNKSKYIPALYGVYKGLSGYANELEYFNNKTALDGLVNSGKSGFNNKALDVLISSRKRYIPDALFYKKEYKDKFIENMRMAKETDKKRYDKVKSIINSYYPKYKI